ncbi:MAG: glycosyltransferase family 4 protein [Alphaproteobacteria bacterium]|nr:glycosyltransferase family 4 protein [Alphaproteobacteria bacterium]
MRIVHVVRQYAPSVGGFEDVVANLCRNLNCIPGVEARVVTLDRIFTAPDKKLPAHEIVNGVDVQRISWFGSKRYPVALGILKAIEDADIVHVHAIDFFFDFLAVTKFLHRKPLVVSTHGGFFHTPFAARLKKLYFQTVSRFSCLAYHSICASSDNDALTFSQISKNKVITIENGVDIDKWWQAGSPDLKRTLISIGRWSNNKRVPSLFDLLAHLRVLNAQWRLIVAGVPWHETKDGLLQVARQRGVADALEIVENPGQDKIKTLIGQSSYIVSASEYEGFGITAIEGISAGLIPILTAIPPFQKIRNALGVNMTLAPEDISGSAQALETLHEAMAHTYGDCREASMRLAQNYAWPDTVGHFMKIYENCLDSE